MRILTWINGFINDSRKAKKSGLLTTEEVEGSRKHLIKQAQREVEHSEKFMDNQKRVNLEYMNVTVELKEHIQCTYHHSQL